MAARVRDAAVTPGAARQNRTLIGRASRDICQVVTDVDFNRLEIAVPAFATLILIPLTFSITQGILWGFILHVALFAIAGRRRELSHAVVALAMLALALIVLEHTT